MTSGIPAPLLSTDSHDREGLAAAVAARIAEHPPRLLGLGEPMHGEDEFGLLRNAVFAALVERTGVATIALEISAWHARVVDAYVRGGDGDEDAVMAAGFTHEWGGFAANRALVRWLREQNRHRAPAEQLRFAGFDAPVEMHAAPSPRPELRLLHEFLSSRGADVRAWETVDELLGPDEPWEEPAAAMDPARSIGSDPRVRDLTAITDDLCRTLEGDVPRLRGEVDPDALAEALLAGRAAAGLLAYHRAMADDIEHRWQRLAALRDTMMAANLGALVERGPTFVFAHNEHLRTGAVRMAFGPQVLGWLPAGAFLADRLGGDYRVIACALGADVEQEIPEPPADTVEGALYRGLPPGNHLLPAPDLHAIRSRYTTRVSPTYRYLPIDDSFLGEVDELLFLRTVDSVEHDVVVIE
jgi:erythromycin esterase-like protein